MKYVLPLSELKREDLALAGGKGANLGAMIAAGLPVPGGFCVTTNAYRCFLEDNRLQMRILSIVTAAQPDQMESLEAASAAIQALFEAGKLPQDVQAEICAAAAGVAGPVAVRSSATAEDLPDLSFAGQQDTYLNISGEAELLRAVVRCWASLWTARAIGYRVHNGISQDEVALAVVVQQMVQSEASGVLFTVNPLTGIRSETVIDATLGLGEALVSGQVEPDHYGVDAKAGRILQKTLGQKALAIRGVAGGGTQTIHADSAQVQALPDEQILALTRLGQQAATLFGLPQDMEWAWADDKLFVLQSRAITSLYPLPQGITEDRLEVFFSFGAAQGMLDPVSPLGQDTFAGLFVGIGRHFGGKSTISNQRMFLSAGERSYLNITGLFRNEVGRKLIPTIAKFLDPTMIGTFQELLDDPRLAPSGPWKLSSRLRTARGFLPLIVNVVYNLIAPRQGRERISRNIDKNIQKVTERAAAVKDLQSLSSTLEENWTRMPLILLPYLLPGVIAGQVPFQLLLHQAEQVENGPATVLELTRGLPHNVTTEMDLALWQTAQAVRADQESLAHFQQTDTADLSAEYLAGKLPRPAQEAVESFLRLYGARGVAEIDIYRVRWGENPQHVFQVLKSYLEFGPDTLTPEKVFENGAVRAEAARQELITAFGKTRFGWLKAHLVKALTLRLRELAGLRETPKFAIVRMLKPMRESIWRVGRDLAAKGMLDDGDDLFFLHIWEIRELAAGRLANYRHLICQRRQARERELARKRIPRMILSDGRTIYDGVASQVAADGTEVLKGSPVSAGIVEGKVHVVFNPHETQLQPGEILVCPGTDPAWTPLFLAAGGLVMEVGGMMTHGSVVAREYGIPAVVGVSQVTSRLKTGQRVRVDGSTGLVTILENL